MYKKLIIGLGSGRSGTVSLKTLLNTQHNFYISHEHRPLLPWNVNIGALIDKLEVLLFQDDYGKQNETIFSGDVAFYYLPYVDHILQIHPNTIFICMKRDQKTTVDSYMKWTEGRNHWCEHNGTVWRLDPEWDVCYPKYLLNAKNIGYPLGADKIKRKQLEVYWKSYYLEAKQLQNLYPDKFIIMDMYDLNKKDEIRALLYKLGINYKDQVIKTNIHENKGKY